MNIKKSVWLKFTVDIVLSVVDGWTDGH